MKTPPAAGSVVRIGVALLLCAACFEAGRAYQELSASAAGKTKPDPGTEMVDASFVGPTLAGPAAEAAGTAAPGDPVGESGDIITPLNVRDPSALVMGPGGFHQTCPPPEPSVVDPDRPADEPKPKKMKEGRLLELLKKADKNPSSPKRY